MGGNNSKPSIISYEDALKRSNCQKEKFPSNSTFFFF